MRGPVRVVSSVVVSALVAALGVLFVGVGPAAAEEVVTVPADGVLRLEGRGYGHGRGLSQWGSYGAASLGVPWPQIVDTYYPGTTRVQAGNPLMRVRITRSTGPVVRTDGDLRAVVDPSTGASVALPAGTDRCETGAFGTGVEVWCRLGGGPGQMVARWGQAELRGSAGIAVPQSDGVTRAYRGAVRVARDGSQVVAVVALSMQEYLYGVVPRESPASWPADALAAQAVAARTYASFERVQAGGGGAWDTCDTTACQVFGGTWERSPSGVVKQLESASTTRAVDVTAGLEQHYQGRPAFAQFSASNGGYSLAGSSSQPYLAARPDPWDGAVPNNANAWTDTLTAGELQARWPQVGTLQRFTVVARDGNGEWGGRITTVRLTGTGGSVEVSGDAIRSAGDLKSRWFRVLGAEASNPFGRLEQARGTTRTIEVAGWAADPDTSEPVDVHVYVDGQARQVVRADRDRPDVGAAYPALGSRHGFSTAVGLITPGRHTVCVYGINVGPGTGSTTLGCSTVDVQSGQSPVGSLDGASAVPGGFRVRGWAIDPDTAAAIDVHTYVDGRPAAVTRADVPRPDVGRAYPSAGPDHGYEVPVATGARSQVCTYGINVDGGPGNSTLGCRTLTRPVDPVGSFDSLVRLDASRVELRGWSLDPDTAAPVDVHVYVGAGLAGIVTASADRPDVGAAFPGWGSAHGWTATVAAPPGATVCAYGINVGAGTSNPRLGCRTA